MKLLGDSAADRIRTRRSVRNVCLSTSALGSALIVAAIMQASSAAAAGCPKFSALALSYTVAGESLSAVKTETCIPGKTVDMQAGDDGLSFDANLTFNQFLKVDGGDDADTLHVSAGKTLRVAGLTQIQNVETVSNEGKIIASGGLLYKGTPGADDLENAAMGIIRVTGDATFDGAGGVDSFTNDGRLNVLAPGNALTVKNFETVSNGGFINTNGGPATFTGTGAGSSLQNDGLIKAGTLNISNFQTVTNNGTIRDDLNYSGTAGNDTFTNNGTLDITGTGTFSFGAGDDTLTNNNRLTADILNLGGGPGTDGIVNVGVLKAGAISISGFENVNNSGILASSGNLTYSGTTADDTFTNSKVVGVTGTGKFSFAAGNDTLDNSGTMKGGSFVFSGGTGSDDIQNTGKIIAGSVAISGFETVNTSKLITTTGDLTYAGTAADDVFTNTSQITVGGAASFDGAGGTNDQLLNTGGTITVTGLTTIKNFEVVTNTGIIKAKGGLDYLGSAAAETFTNSGTLSVTGAGAFAFGAGADTLTNSGTMLAGSFAFDGGTGADSLLNSGAIRAGTVAISGFETVSNSKLITTTGDMTYTGTSANDTFTNTSQITVGGAASFDGAGGAGDQLLNTGGTITVTGLTTIKNFEVVTNSGTIKAKGGLAYLGSASDETITNSGILNVTGAAGFDGAGGTNDQLLNSGVMSVTGLTTISNFETFTNSGTLNAKGGLDYQGSATAETFTNSGALNVTGAGSFDGGGGTNVMTNAASGTLSVDGVAAIKNFETVTNDGTMVFNSKGNLPSGTTVATIDVGAGNTFTNNGTIDLHQDAGPVRFGDNVDITGNADLPGTLSLDISLRDGGIADNLTVSGDVTGAVAFDFHYDTSGTYLLLDGGRMDLVSAGGDTSLLSVGSANTAGGGAVGADSLIDSSGLIDYFLRKDDTGIFVESLLDSAKAGGLAGAFGGALTSVGAIFQKPVSSFVSTCKTGDENSHGFGTWFRASNGSLDTETNGTSTLDGAPLGAVASKNTTKYYGLQGGADIATCNIGGTTTVHTGLTVGQVTGTSTQTNAAEFLTMDFDSKFVGGYVALIHNSGFTADANVRYDFHNFDLSHTDTTVLAPGTKVDGSTISGSVGAAYNYTLDNSIGIRPAVGLAVSKTSVDPFSVNGTGTFAYDDQISIMGQAALTFSKTFDVTDTSRVQAFLSGAVFHEFGEKGHSTFDLGEVVDVKTSNIGTFEQVGAGLTFIVDGGSAPTEPKFASGIRLDAQFGDRLEGWALTGQARLQF